MGSDSDLPVMKAAGDFLDSIDLPWEMRIISAHRTPERLQEWAQNAAGNGMKVIIAAAGGAAHLAGVTASITELPVIGVPIRSKTLDGLDSLLSTVQMPSGIPVATVAVDGAKNAAILAARILALSNPELGKKLLEQKKAMQAEVIAKDSALLEAGPKDYQAPKADWAGLSGSPSAKV